MRYFIVCPMDDTIDLGAFELSGENRIRGGVELQTYTPPEPPLYPFVPAYFQNYRQQRAPLRAALRKLSTGIRPRSCLLALHDDATDLEAHAMSELLIACGVKETLMEYRAFLLSSESAYIAVTGSKRAVAVTAVTDETTDTDRIFIPVHEATPEAVLEAVHALNPEGVMPVYAFGLPEQLSGVGEAVNTQEIVRNFVKLQ